MTTTTPRARFIPTAAFPLIVALLLAGCALPLPDKPVRAVPFDLGPAPDIAATGAATGAPLALPSIEAPAALDGTAIVYRLLYAGGDQQPRPYALARWSMAPAQLLTQRLRQALATRHAVLDAGSGLATLELRAELDEFAQLYSAPTASEGVVRLRVTATTARSPARLLGQRTFFARRSAPTPDAAGGAQALREASDQVIRDIADWVMALPVE